MCRFLLNIHTFSTLAVERHGRTLRIEKNATFWAVGGVIGYDQTPPLPDPHLGSSQPAGPKEPEDCAPSSRPDTAPSMEDPPEETLELGKKKLKT